MFGGQWLQLPAYFCTTTHRPMCSVSELNILQPLVQLFVCFSHVVASLAH